MMSAFIQLFFTIWTFLYNVLSFPVYIWRKGTAPHHVDDIVDVKPGNIAPVITGNHVQVATIVTNVISVLGNGEEKPNHLFELYHQGICPSLGRVNYGYDHQIIPPKVQAEMLAQALDCYGPKAEFGRHRESITSTSSDSSHDGVSSFDTESVTTCTTSVDSCDSYDKDKLVLGGGAEEETLESDRSMESMNSYYTCDEGDHEDEAKDIDIPFFFPFSVKGYPSPSRFIEMFDNEF